MLRSSKSPAPAAGAGGAGAAAEVAVQKVDRIDVLSLVHRPIIRGVTRATPGSGGGAEGDDINRKAEEFIKVRQMWFHRKKPGGPAASDP